MGRLRPRSVLLAAVVVAAACYAPTEMRISLSTDVDCTDTLTVGIYTDRSAAPVATKTSCAKDPGSALASLGDLVVVPRGARDATVQIEVRLATDGNLDGCYGGGATCVVARRSISFIAHASRDLPIRLDRACLGVTCGDATSNETCVAGTCESADTSQQNFCVGPDGTTPCDEPPGPTAPPDAGADGGDVTDPTDASDGSAPPCAGLGGGVVANAIEAPSGNLVVSGSALYWGVTKAGSAGLYSVATTGGTQKLEVPQSDWTSGQVLLAAASGEQWYIAPAGADSSTVYHRAGGALVQATVQGANYSGLALGLAGTPAGSDTLLYLYDGDRVSSLPSQFDVGQAAVPVGGAASGNGFAVARHYAFVVDGTKGKLVALDGDPGTPSGPAATVSAAVARGGDDRVFAIAQAKTAIVSFDATPDAGMQTLAPAAGAKGIALPPAADRVYWIEGNAILSAPVIVSGFGTGQAVKLPAASTVEGLAVDDACVYFWGTSLAAGTDDAVTLYAAPR